MAMRITKEIDVECQHDQRKAVGYVSLKDPPRNAAAIGVHNARARDSGRLTRFSDCLQPS
jgi:hypothetical protein